MICVGLILALNILINASIRQIKNTNNIELSNINFYIDVFTFLIISVQNKPIHIIVLNRKVIYDNDPLSALDLLFKIFLFFVLYIF